MGMSGNYHLPYGSVTDQVLKDSQINSKIVGTVFGIFDHHRYLLLKEQYKQAIQTSLVSIHFQGLSIDMSLCRHLVEFLDHEFHA